jgi:hypothetical protein
MSASQSQTWTQTPFVSATLTPTASQTRDTFYTQANLILIQGFYPNPFKTTLQIYYTLRVDAQVRVAVYDVAGEAVTELRQAGLAGVNLLSWQGDNQFGGRCASGIYVLHALAQGNDGSSGQFWGTVAIAR